MGGAPRGAFAVTPKAPAFESAAPARPAILRELVGGLMDRNGRPSQNLLSAEKATMDHIKGFSPSRLASVAPDVDFAVLYIATLSHCGVRGGGGPERPSPPLHQPF